MTMQLSKKSLQNNSIIVCTNSIESKWKNWNEISWIVVFRNRDIVFKRCFVVCFRFSKVHEAKQTRTRKKHKQSNTNTASRTNYWTFLSFLVVFFCESEHIKGECQKEFLYNQFGFCVFFTFFVYMWNFVCKTKT